MSAKVTLRVERGLMAGQTLVVDSHDTVLAGRSEDCQIRLPKEDKTVSRHHFIIEINPPRVHIKDFGSLNGTYVNDIKHGGRQPGETPEDAAQRVVPAVEIKDGDRIRVGETVLTVAIEAPMYCCDCGVEIEDEARRQCVQADGTYVCPACKAKKVAVARKPPLPPPIQPAIRCRKCGRDLAREMGVNRGGLPICAACRADPQNLIGVLLGLAGSGPKNLMAIKGYTVEKELGRGGMGLVYLARHDRSGERIALKVMLPQVAANERAKKQFLREMDINKALKHPNVVELKETGCSEGVFFCTLEFCEGGSVDRLRIKRGGRIPLDEAMHIIREVLDGLDYAHHAEIRGVLLKDGSTGTAHGVVHRDVSPHNMLLAGTGRSALAKVSDYGLTKAFDLAGLTDGTRTGNVAGKPVFWPRQQVINYRYAKPDVDVWASAASLYNMLTGAYPREFTPGCDAIKIVLDTDPVPILKRNAAIPRRLAEVIDHALIDKPEIPFKTAAELKKALEKAL